MINPWEITVGEDGPAVAVAPPPAEGRMPASPQQVAFYEELLGGTSHVVLEARAGTGKSTSCREAMWRLLDRDPRLAIRYCCFNKKIADEFEAKCPPGVEVGTMHRFGLQALQSAFGCQVDKNKSYTILDSLKGGADLKGYYRRAIVKLVGLAKNHGLKPGDPLLPLAMDEYVERFDIECYRERGMIVDRAARVIELSATMTSLVDFDDMLWLTVLHPVRFPSVDFLFIDELQDLNPVQHEMAERLSDSGRTVGVGDPFQSIYAFRGADPDSIARFIAKLDAKVLPLTVTFRCPRSHVELARQMVSDFEAAPDAPEGTVILGDKGLIDLAGPGDMVLCRANAPIVQACLRQIANLKPAIVRGRSIGDSLLAVSRKVGDAATIADYSRNLARWRSKEVMRLEAKDGCEDLMEQVQDKCASLDAIASACSSPSEIPGAINALFADDDAANRVTFSSVHRAKGSEAERVTYLQIPYGEKRDKLRPPQAWELQQRRNLRYVALSRSLDTLTLIS